MSRKNNFDAYYVLEFKAITDIFLKELLHQTYIMIFPEKNVFSVFFILKQILKIKHIMINFRAHMFITLENSIPIQKMNVKFCIIFTFPPILNKL